MERTSSLPLAELARHQLDDIHDALAAFFQTRIAGRTVAADLFRHHSLILEVLQNRVPSLVCKI